MSHELLEALSCYRGTSNRTWRSACSFVVIEMFNAVLNDVIGIDGYIEAALSDLSICNANTTLGKSNRCDGDGDCDGV
jgi:hypothetical protein